MVSLGARLREEREARGLSQEAFGAIGGVTKKSQINYEKNERSPDATYLTAVAAAGADVLYILTGQRQGGAVATPPPAPELPRQEQEWLAIYRNSSDEVRTALKAAGDALTKPASGRRKAA